MRQFEFLQLSFPEKILKLFGDQEQASLFRCEY